MDKITFPLFLPGTRMDRFEKAATSGADAVIVDLEDAVALDQKDRARQELADSLGESDPPVPVIVRINAVGTDWHAADVAVCAGLPITAIMLAKAESAEACRSVTQDTGKSVVALVETALGLHNAPGIARGCDRLAFGSIDYAADLGIAHEPECLSHARASLVLAARLAGQAAPWDGVTANIRDEDINLSDARLSQKMGFGGKLLIHPSQIAPARRGFAPSDTEVHWARRVVEAAQVGGSAVKMDGAMVDAPVVKRAEAILSRAPAA